MIINSAPDAAYLSLGSNSPAKAAKMAQALRAIASMPGLRLLAVSPVFETEPQGFSAQDWFLNQCVKVSVQDGIGPRGLLARLLSVEADLGRVRKGAARFGPREIDIDLLFFGGACADDGFLKLPHPRMRERAFVLLPLLIIEPGLELFGESLSGWLGRLNWRLEGRKILQS